MIENDKRKEMSQVYQIIKEYSSDSLNYLSFNEENEFFFGKNGKGVIPYIINGKKSMSIGNPICKIEDIENLVDEYINFCKEKNLKPIFTSVSDEMMKILKERNYSVIEYGEEPILDLKDFSLEGSRRAILRRNVKNVNNNGVELIEYQPQKERDYELEKQIENLSCEWYKSKKFKMNYSIGTIDFKNTYDRKFFVTKNKKGEIQTFLSFLPYSNGKKYCIDIMHRKLDTMTGVMEHAIVSAILKMKKDGIEEVSLGLAPLANIDITKENTSTAERLLNSIFNNTNLGYNFKNLFRFKKKFAPNIWKKRYLVYHKDIPLVNLALTITNTKRGKIDIKLYLRYKFFIIADIIRQYKLKSKI